MRVKIHPLTLVMAAMAIWLGEWERLAITSASLLLHEMGHLTAARAAGVEVTELELLPLGGAIRLRGAWEMRPGQLLCVALAGPAVNLLILCGATVAEKAVWVNVNLLMLLFNLLPALPLDGGRALTGILCRRMRLKKAVRAAIWGGRLAGGGLLALFGQSMLAGRANVTFLISGIYMLLCAGREGTAAEAAGILSMAAREMEMRREGALPVRILAVPAQSSVREVAMHFVPRHVHVVWVWDGETGNMGMMTEREMAKWMREDPGKRLGSAVKKSACI